MKEYYGAYDTYTGQFEIDDYAFIDKGHAVVTHFKQKQTKDLEKMKKYGKRSVLKKSSPRPIVTSSDYLILLNANLKGVYDSDPYQPDHLKKKKGEKWELLIYKREGDHLRKSTLDLFQLREPTKGTLSIYGPILPLQNGHKGLKVIVSASTRIIDLTTHKLMDGNVYKESIENPNSRANELAYQALVYPDLPDDDSNNRFRDVGMSDFSTSYASLFDSKKLKSQGANLPIASQYPKAYQLLLKDNSYLSMMVDDLKVDTKANASVLGLFNKDGEAGVFKDLPISEFRAVDKQEHTVNSYEEFMRYYNFSR
ncbi:hypothetical protein ACVR0S_07775 [Streptococcus dentapri]|uniref:Lipoprotein n=1 Tax=Streptococcus dentapri TaxID=573564 RepID=A0ABV8D0A2_9STRE